MWIDTSARWVRGHAPPENVCKNGAIWCILSVPTHAIINLKINNLKEYKSTKILFAIFFSSINRDVHVNKLIHFIRGVWGVSSPRSQRMFQKMEAFPLRRDF